MKREPLFFLLPLLSVLACSCTTLPAASAPPVEAINAPGARSMGPYSQAVRAGDYVFLSGVVAFDSKAGHFAEAKIGPQTRQVFANLQTVLKAAGLGLNNVVKTTVYLRNPTDFAAMNTLYGQYFSARKPARSTIPGVNWGRPDVLIEIEAVAYDPRPR